MLRSPVHSLPVKVAFRINAIETGRAANTGETEMFSKNNALSILSVVNQLNAQRFTDGHDSLPATPGTPTQYDGLAGNDTLTYTSAASAAVASLMPNAVNSGAATGHTYRNIENLTGSRFADRLTGDDNANLLDGGVGADTLTGGKGNDTYLVDNVADRTIELASEGIDTVMASINWSLAAHLENLTLTGSAAINGTGNAENNIIIGNAARNTLTGGAGNDTLDGGAGADTLVGGVGNDIYIVDNVGDRVTEGANAGTDTVRASVTYTLSAHVENLALIGFANINGTGNTLNNVLTGNAGNNILNGGAGNDTMDGGAGNDTLIGGAGDDTYVVDQAGDIVTEAARSGTDTVLSTAGSYTLTANVENLTLLGAAKINGTGNTLANTITGNSASNVLDGREGDDILYGRSGDDTLNGGDGIDYLFGEEGNDELIGDAGDDWLFGGAGRDILSGGGGDDNLDGGAGLDEMRGGNGNDIYTVSATDDKVIEDDQQGGTDTVKAFVTFTLGDHVEVLDLMGDADINGFGNSAANIITGNDGANAIHGGGGNDTLHGGAGDDELVVNGADGDQSWVYGGTGDDRIDAEDGSGTLYGGEGNDIYDVLGNYTIVEEVDGGTDTLIGYGFFTLGAHVENGILRSAQGNDKLTGNELDNELRLGEAGGDLEGMGGDDILVGGSGDNKLYGGAGNDSLNGGSGADILDGGEGIDTAVFAGARDDYSFIWNAEDSTLSITGSGQTDILSNIEILDFYGSTYDGPLSELDVTSARNITGNDQDNTLNGANGNDVLVGGAGNDTLTGGLGNDVLNGGEGDDTAVFTQEQANYTFAWNAATSTLTVTGFDGVDTLIGIEKLDFAGQIYSGDFAVL